jgi:hypothetical protein
MARIDMSKMTCGGPAYFSSEKSALYYIDFMQAHADYLRSVDNDIACGNCARSKDRAKASLAAMLTAEKEAASWRR